MTTAPSHVHVPRNAFRFAAGAPDGPHGSVWRLWGNKKGDCYLSTRYQGSQFKLSFHRDGNCQLGFTSEFADAARALYRRAGPRHWERWAIPLDQFVEAFRIYVPASELRPQPVDKPNDVIWVGSVPAPGLTMFTLFLWSTHLTPDVSNVHPGTGAVGAIVTNSRCASVAFLHGGMDESLLQVVERERSRLMALPPADPSHNRAVLFTESKATPPHALELALC